MEVRVHLAKALRVRDAVRFELARLRLIVRKFTRKGTGWMQQAGAGSRPLEPPHDRSNLGCHAGDE